MTGTVAALVLHVLTGGTLHVRRSPTPVAAAVAVAAVLTAACTAAEDTDMAQSPTSPPSPPAVASPTPTPSPPPPPVQGAASVRLMPVAPEPVVLAGEQPETDQRTVRDLVQATTRWLDAHLTDLQEGGGGRIGQVAAPSLVRGSSSRARASVTRELVPEGAVVDTARYDMLVAVDGTARWLRATVDVRRRDGGSHSAQFVFVPHGRLPRLLAAGPTDTSEPPPPPSPAETRTPSPGATDTGDGA